MANKLNLFRHGASLLANIFGVGSSDWLDLLVAIQLVDVSFLLVIRRTPVRSEQKEASDKNHDTGADQPGTDYRPKTTAHNDQHTSNQTPPRDPHYELRCFGLVRRNWCRYYVFVHAGRFRSNEKELSHRWRRRARQTSRTVS